MKRLTHLLLALATGILLLHSIVPHRHACEAGSKVVAEQQEILDLLSYLFRFDIGDHHLENIITEDVDLVSDVSFTGIQRWFRVASVVPPPRLSARIQVSNFDAPAALRGPPFMIAA